MWKGAENPWIKELLSGEQVPATPKRGNVFRIQSGQPLHSFSVSTVLLNVNTAFTWRVQFMCIKYNWYLKRECWTPIASGLNLLSLLALHPWHCRYLCHSAHTSQIAHIIFFFCCSSYGRDDFPTAMQGLCQGQQFRTSSLKEYFKIRKPHTYCVLMTAVTGK